jgi:ribose 1,5-bisphosphokinase PhnN
MAGVTKQESIVALCGPSGVGKSYTKRLIRERAGADFSEPVVASTRLSRPSDDRSRHTGLKIDAFHAMVKHGEIVLPHQPFRQPESPWYGFMAESFTTRTPILTEVHSSILQNFVEFVQGRPLLIIGLIASRATLESNIDQRQGDFSDGIASSIRVDAASIEEAEITTGYEDGIVHHLLHCNQDMRTESQLRAAELVHGFIGGHHV